MELIMKIVFVKSTLWGYFVVYIHILLQRYVSVVRNFSVYLKYIYCFAVHSEHEAST